MQKRHIIIEIEQNFLGLNNDEQLELLERLIHILRDKPKNNNYKKSQIFNWDKFYGIAKGLWLKEDAQDYVDRLREDRI
jgi:hypothetical protein